MYMCILCAWPYVYVCVSASVHMPQHMCAGQRAASSVGPHLLSCSGLQKPDPRGFGSSPFLSPVSLEECWGHIYNDSRFFYTCPGDPDSGPQAHTSSTLHTELPPHPTRKQFYWTEFHCRSAHIEGQLAERWSPEAGHAKFATHREVPRARGQRELLGTVSVGRGPFASPCDVRRVRLQYVLTRQ